MKVVCDACQAKYQIPDERVAGRRLKIRCRKCGNTIVVRGDDGNGEHAMLESLTPPPAEIEWHVSLGGDQHGPYATVQMAEMLRAGQLAWDAHVWRESYADWKMAGDSDTLVRAVASSAEDAPTAAVFAPQRPVAMGTNGAGDDTPTRMVQSSPGLTTDVLPPAARTAFAARSAARQSQPPHVFAAAGFAAQPDVFASPRVDAAGLTGERHEDSVLFSARNLNTTPTPLARAGYAGAEGSGLIDIRALAALARNSQSATPAPPEAVSATGRRGRDEVLALANQTGAFGNLDSLAPIDRPSQAPNKMLPVAILGGSAMLAVAAVLVVYLSRPAAAPQVVAVAAPIAAESAAPLAPTPAATPSAATLAAIAAPTAPPAVAEPAAPARTATSSKRAVQDLAEDTTAKAPIGRAVVAAKLARGAAPKAPRAANGRSAKAGEPKADVEPIDTSAAKATKTEKSPSIDDLLSGKKPDKADEPEAVAATAAPAKAKEPAKSRSIDELLDDAVPAKKAAAEAASAALPDAPTRDQVIAAMHGVEAEVQACAEGQELDSPAASVAVTVSGASGRVSNVHVTGISGTIGSCVARAVRAASFPKFAKATFSINYPFKLKK